MPSVFEPLIALARKPLEFEDAGWLLDTINKGDDTAAAIVGGVFVESALNDAIHARLVDLTPPQKQELGRSGGPLSTFDSKIVLGRALGLFDSPTKHDLTIIRHVRNAFAHGSRSVSFSAPEVMAACETFHCLKAGKHFADKTPETSREKFASAIRLLVMLFLALVAIPQRPPATRSFEDNMVDLIVNRSSPGK